MAEKKLFGTYFVKKFIVEIKHKPNLLHNEKVPQVLNDMMGDFNKVNLIEGSNKIFQLINNNDYFLINSDWTKIFTIYENVEDFESVCQKAKKNVVNYLTKLKLSEITRLGFRTIFLLPFNGAFDELVDYFNNTFYNNLSFYESFGTIEDVGIVALTIKDSQFRGNLSFGPMIKNEVKNKLSEFKKYDKDFDTSLYIDLDLYNDASPIPTINAFIDNAYNASRIKIIKFRELLNS
ncbi:MAG: hypothetical protein ABI550_03945 [Ignavibacteriaceae bacterium]